MSEAILILYKKAIKERDALRSENALLTKEVADLTTENIRLKVRLEMEEEKSKSEYINGYNAGYCDCDRKRKDGRV